MSIVILLICFFSIFLNIGIISNGKINVKEVLLRSVLVFSVILVSITEFISFFHILNFWFILMTWIGIFLMNFFFLYFKRDELSSFIAIHIHNIRKAFLGLNKFEKSLFFSVIALLIFTFIQGLIYPPNNWDSMSYHMARITNWISHQSIEHYPTPIARQLYQPPFSEFVIMHFNILNGGDYFSNSVQLFFLGFSLIAIVSIVELLGLSRQYKLIAVVLTVTIPEAILQASSTQNDIVVSFFILTAIYFAVKSIKEVLFQNYFFLGISIGLGALTKGTAYIYIAPILFIFAIEVFIKLYKTKNYTYIGYSLVTALVFICINSGYYIRNYHLNKNILGVDKTESKCYSNEKMTPLLFLSNITRNAGLQIGPFPINIVSNKVIYMLHSVAGVDVNNPATTFLDTKYSGSPSIPNHEDNASNPIHFYFIILSFILISIAVFKNKTGFSKIVLYLIMVSLQAMIFCLYLRWQPWHSRLHTPLFMLSIPIVCYAISVNGKFYKILYKILPFIILYACLVISFNWSRPFLSNKYTARISVSDIRYKKYFVNRPELFGEYNVIMERVLKMNYKNIGILLRDDDWEYPLFSQFYGKGINPIHINVLNGTKNIPVAMDNINCIVSTKIKDAVIDFKGKRFYNQDVKNKNIWFYMPNK